MNTIKMNNNTYQVLNFNKNVSFQNDSIYGSGTCAISTPDVTSLNELVQNEIELIEIYHDDTLIYSSNSVGKITSINEYLAENRVEINLNISFDYNTPEQNTSIEEMTGEEE